jgi:hypothetical protein
MQTISFTSAGGPGGAIGTDDASIGTAAWGSPERIAYCSDSQSALNSLGSLSVSHYLKAVNFGFPVPTGSTIVGVACDVLGNASGNPGEINDNSVRLVKGGTISGSNNAIGAGWNPTGTTVSRSWGGPTDMWGLTLTSSDVNDSTFGFALAVGNSSASQVRSLQVPCCSMTVYYIPPPSVPLSGYVAMGQIGTAAGRVG